MEGHEACSAVARAMKEVDIDCRVLQPDKGHCSRLKGSKQFTMRCHARGGISRTQAVSILPLLAVGCAAPSEIEEHTSKKERIEAASADSKSVAPPPAEPLGLGNSRSAGEILVRWQDSSQSFRATTLHAVVENTTERFHRD